MELIGEMRTLVEKERESIRATEESIGAGAAKLARAERCAGLLKARPILAMQWQRPPPE